MSELEALLRPGATASEIDRKDRFGVRIEKNDLIEADGCRAV